jgi:hypothetical protein
MAPLAKAMIGCFVGEIYVARKSIPSGSSQEIPARKEDL